MSVIVKRGGHTEDYDGRKLYASIFLACLTVREPVVTAELVANKVQEAVDKWVKNKHEVTSNDIRREAAKHMEVINPPAAYQYKHHRVVW